MKEDLRAIGLFFATLGSIFALLLLVTALTFIFVGCGSELDCYDGCAHDGATGPQGPQGDTGPQGEPGQDAEPAATSSCTVVQANAGAILTCEDGTIAILRHGDSGESGVTAVIDPCGRQGALDEVLLVVNHEYVLRVERRKEQSYLTRLYPGKHSTVDGTKCEFTVTAEGRVSWEDPDANP